MCGINGIALSTKSGREIHRETLERMRDILTHRGPDDSGIFIDERIGLGHRRLSIVDVATGHQPMTNEDGSLQIIFNGEIYNHADYRKQLEERGHVYRTHCDTEAILHLYEEHGADCVNFLRGMFAFAIWDKSKRELFIARDRLGVKPLYYAHTDDGSLYFASEIKAILQTKIFKPEINYSALPDYLANHATSGADTLYRHVKRLLPGHTLVWRDGRIAIKRYWDVSFAKADGIPRPDKDYIEEWSELFRTSVRLRLMADVPLGMFLSGGIDSSAIAAVMSRMVDEPIQTFSVAFSEREANELAYARIVSKAYRTRHHEVTVQPEEFFKALPKLVWHEDEPLAHPSSVALYFVSQLASRHVKVVLTGEGSDELLAGYGRYRKTVLNISAAKQYRHYTPRLLRDAVRSGITALPASGLRQKLLRSFLAVPPDIERIYFDNFAVFPAHLQSELLSRDSLDKVGVLNPYAGVRSALDATDAKALLDQLLYADIKTYLHELLMKQDQMSMAASIESRVPFLDHKLVEFSCALPERLKLRGGITKYILRESMKAVLPEEILSRPKMGFPVPIGSWFRGSWRSIIDEYVLSDRATSRGIFNPDTVKSLVSRHQAGSENHDERLWALVNFEIWQRQFFDGESLHEREAEREIDKVVTP